MGSVKIRYEDLQEATIVRWKAKYGKNNISQVDIPLKSATVSYIIKCPTDIRSYYPLDSVKISEISKVIIDSMFEDVVLAGDLSQIFKNWLKIGVPLLNAIIQHIECFASLDQ